MRFEGIFVPNVTPFDGSGEVDYATLRAFLDYLIKAGVQGIVPCGSTGEGPSLTFEEKKELISAAVGHARHRVTVIAGTGCLTTEETIRLSRHAEDVGADGLLVIPPYYFVLDEREIFKHYASVASSVDLPIVLYNNPGTSKIDVRPELIAKLGKAGHVAYVKESSAPLQRVSEVIRRSQGKVGVFSGMDDTFLEALRLGARGWITALANVFPDLCVRIFELESKKHNHESAAVYANRIRPLGEVSEASGKFVQYMKCGVEFTWGKPVGAPRKPLLPLTPKEQRSVKQVIEAAKLQL
jgi:4-hydroxy-tetrahydrodipicolinate synthase